jgi:iron(II)-dependent oxidoreductase
MDDATLADWVADAGGRTEDLVADLTDAQWLGPPRATINPPVWELGHLAWFTEKWVLRHAGERPPLRAEADTLYDSAAIPHAVRWDLPFPSPAVTLDYVRQVREAVLDVIARGPSPCERYFIRLAVFHEDMHGESFFQTWQTLEYARPKIRGSVVPPAAGPLPGDVAIPGGTFQLGANQTELFVFDNEKWAHAVEVRPFAIARAPVTQAEFAVFIEDGGYVRQELWSPAGWAWRVAAAAERPVYWRRDRSGWHRRDFADWLPLEPHRPVIHVNWYEADAYCRWAGRRLPTEAEWETAASFDRAGPKRRFPWGDDLPGATRANLDVVALGCCDIGAFSAGDSAAGCRQMIGNVWEWTATDFGPYPGFEPDPYKEYSQPWFGTHKVLRGGAWPTRARLIRNTWRNFYTPERRDVWAGFRTCAIYEGRRG